MNLDVAAAARDASRVPYPGVASRVTYIAVRFEPRRHGRSVERRARRRRRARGRLVGSVRRHCGRDPPLWRAGDVGAESWATSRVMALFRRRPTPRERWTTSGARWAVVPLYETDYGGDQDWVRQTQAQFGRSRSTPASGSCRRGALSRARTRCHCGSTPDSHSAPARTRRPALSRVAACARCRSAAHCSITAAAPAFSRSPRRSSARAACRRGRRSAVVARRADNARANGVEVAFRAPDALPARAFDRVVANILTNPLMRLLAPALAARARRRAPGAHRNPRRPGSRSVAAAYAPLVYTRAVAPERRLDLLTGQRLH